MVPKPLPVSRLAPRASRISSRWLSRPAAWVAIDGLALALLAVVLRADRLMTVPVFTDESMEALLALNTLAAGRLNLVGVSSFLGGFHTWLLMGLIALPGAGVEAPRLLSLVAGVLTVVLTYALGRELGGRWAGLVAGGLLATNLAHITINSRIGWSNCLTPLFMTAGLLLVTRALGRDRPVLLVPAGLALGLGLQTHPSAAALLPGLALGVLLNANGRRWARTRWPWLGGLAALLAYGNVLWYNLTTGGRSLAAAQERDYAVRPATSLGDLLEHLAALGLQLARNLGSSFSAEGPSAPVYPVTLTMLGWPALAVVGGLAAARRGQWAAPLMVLVAIPLMALVGGEYQPLPHASSRYLGSLWPVLAALAGLGAVTLGRWLAGLVAGTRPPAGWQRAAGRVGPAVVAALCLALVAMPVLTVRSYLDWYDKRPWLGSFNQFALDITEEAATRFPGRTVYLDTGLHEDGSSDAGTMYRSLAMLLGLHGNPTVALPRSQRQTARAVWERLDRAPGPAILRRDHATQFTAEGAHLTPVGTATRVIDPAEGEYRLYELTFTTAGP